MSNEAELRREGMPQRALPRSMDAARARVKSALDTLASELCAVSASGYREAIFEVDAFVQHRDLIFRRVFGE